MELWFAFAAEGAVVLGKACETTIPWRSIQRIRTLCTLIPNFLWYRFTRDCRHQVTHLLHFCELLGSVQSISHIGFGLTLECDDWLFRNEKSYLNGRINLNP